MSSIATKRGDGGQTDLAGGVRVSKACLRVEVSGTLDELNSTLGFARSLCNDTTITDLAREIQRELFQVGAALATLPGRARSRVPVTLEMSDHLTNEVHRIEAEEGILADWSLPGASTPSAAFDVARTVCRRAERVVVRLMDSGEDVPDGVLVYLNRLSDLLWLLGRKIERDAGVNGALRGIAGKEGNHQLTLVLGGARSGKSRYAQSLCSGRDVLFLATARDQGDLEWRARIARHRAERPPGWRTLEAPIDLAAALGSVHEGEAAVIDCLGLWVSNVMDEQRGSVAAEVEAYLLAELERTLDTIAGREVVIVSNEVGGATVPGHPVARSFRDLLGFANQAVARRAERVVLLVAGLPMVLKDAR